MRKTIAAMAWVLRACYPTRRRLAYLLILIAIIAVVALFYSFFMYSRLPKTTGMQESIGKIHARLQLVESLYQVRHQDIIFLQDADVEKNNSLALVMKKGYKTKKALMSPRIISMLKNLTGMRAGMGLLNTASSPVMKTSFIFKLLPHLMADPDSLRPAYHLKTGRQIAEIVIGIPTVKRDKESYLMVTLMHLINGLTNNDLNDILIVVLIGETDLTFILDTAKEIELMFPQQVESGIIEVMSPRASYYPNLDELPQTLGDSLKRVKWRSKQNLDTIYLMSYAQSRGTYYLMLEDDVIAKNKYIQEIKAFTAATSVSTPDWYILEFCHVGGIGKLFKSAQLNDFIIYVQLFYNNMPIDWLIESYLADRVCTIDKSSDAKYGSLPSFYPHSNPPINKVHTSIKEHSEHTLKNAYDGKVFFWGVKPKKGDIVEFRFTKPTIVTSYTFRSGNVKHVTDKFYDTTIEVYQNSRNYTVIGSFDEFGLADGTLKPSLRPICGIRLRVNRDSFYDAILSEIDIKWNKNKHETSPKSAFDRPSKKTGTGGPPEHPYRNKKRKILGRYTL